MDPDVYVSQIDVDLESGVLISKPAEMSIEDFRRFLIGVGTVLAVAQPNHDIGPDEPMLLVLRRFGCALLAETALR